MIEAVLHERRLELALRENAGLTSAATTRSRNISTE